MRKSTKKTIDAELHEVLVAGKVEADNPDAGARAAVVDENALRT